MTVDSEQELLRRAFEDLSGLLSDDDAPQLKDHPGQASDSGTDAVWEVSAPGYVSQLLVEAFQRFTPRDVDRVLGGISPLVRKVMRNPPILVVAPWLSPRSREMLAARDLNYLDLTGNIRLKVARPAIHLRLDGARQDPTPRTKRPVRLQGAASNALVRILTDVRPPYRMVELARASGLSNGYVSRMLDALHEERLVDRPARGGPVTDVDWQGLLRARAEGYSLLKTNNSRSFLARSGANALYEAFTSEQQDQALVTGSFAAEKIVQLTAPTQLALYVPHIDEFAKQHGLMSTDTGGNVVLLRAADDSQIARARQLADGKFHVGVSQLALDCLTGNGRLPEEGEALIEWMAANQSAWRSNKLPVHL